MTKSIIGSIAFAAVAMVATGTGTIAQSYAVQAPVPASSQIGAAQAEAPHLAVQPSSTAPRDIRDFRFVNTTRAVIHAAWISLPTRRAPWIRIDLSSPIGPNGTREIGMAGWHGAQCFFDVRVDLDDGRSMRWRNVNLCRITNLTT